MSEVETKYEPDAIEAHWQEIWDKAGAFAEKGRGEPYYVLEMFPYPSGALHMGHVRNYTLGDVIARYQRMLGRNVLHPMGWDALGLPAENQAIKEGIAPQVRTPKNIEQMKGQMQRLGLGYDWQRELRTCDPSYYRWNQWFFCKLYEKNLIYPRQAEVNYCPGCDTILANEQVHEDGSCWRGHTGVTTRTIREWAFRLTAYADELLQDLDQLQQWPERIVHQQRNWLGRSEGAEVNFQVDLQSLPAHCDKRLLEAHIPQGIGIFTTRVDTIYGCTALLLAPNHPIVDALTLPEQQEAVGQLRTSLQQAGGSRGIGEQEQFGVPLGTYAHHPWRKDKVPIWIANFVIGDYGTGALMCVPAHDTRDYAFAKRVGLPLRPVILPESGKTSPLPDGAYCDDGILCASGPYDGLSSSIARQQLCQDGQAAGFARKVVAWHVRDWGFSRQRYWGTPIPIIYCPTHGPVTVPLEQLPVVLPDFAEVHLTGQGGAPLAKLASFVNTTCPICQQPARREVDTMDTFVDSAWYFARFLDPHNTQMPFAKALADKWLPVHVYLGGPEHAVMHLLYFRFFTKAMRDLGLLSVDEPVQRLITQGMVNAPAYKCSQHGYQPSHVFGGQQAPYTCPTCSQPLQVAVEKMSKSKYNGVDPDAILRTYGADAARMYTLFAAPPEKDLEWQQDGVDGIKRFLSRIWRLLTAQSEHIRKATLPKSMAEGTSADKTIRSLIHKTLAKISREYGERLHFNTAIAAMMELVNHFYAAKWHEANEQSPGFVREGLLLMAQMLAPVAPHMAEEIWYQMGGSGLVCQSEWPKPDPAALIEQSVAIAVQINGKMRGTIQAPPDSSATLVAQLARQQESIDRHLNQQEIVKEIYIANRLLNFVVKKP